VERATLAWFRAADPDVSNSLDDTAQLIAQLREMHHIDVITASSAHDFVWRHFRTPYDLCVYELRDDRAHRFIPPYLVHYPGIAVLRGRPRGALGILQSARLIVTPHSAAVETLQDECPNARVRFAPAGIRPPSPLGGFGAASDVVAALDWPLKGNALTRALAAMSAGKTVIAFESEETADWPALNPQTWKPRDFPGVGDRRAGPCGPAEPILVSIDPRDEEHSLKLAMRRLSTDVALRERLGAAAHEWWTTHATVGHAVKAWEEIIAEALTLPPIAPSAEWSAPDEGTGRAREILAEFGVTVDLF
jgi:hypothetical protein